MRHARTTRIAALGALLGIVCCAPSDRSQVAVDTALAPAGPPNAARAAEGAPVPGPFPEVGVAVDSAGSWCAEFPGGGAHAAFAPGQPVAIVFAGRAAAAARQSRVSRRRATACQTAFAQPRWEGYVAYDLEPAGTMDAAATGAPVVTLAVASDATWTRGPDHVVRSDLDRDGVVEEARACTADEGEHFTVWSVDGPLRRRRAHEYFDWGAMTEPTCRAGESGER